MKRLALCITLVAACILAPGRAVAAIDIFGRFTGINGESTAIGHERWIDVLSFSWGAGNSGSPFIGTGSGTANNEFEPFSFMKYVDQSTPPLILSVASGKIIPEALFHVVQTGQGPIPFLEYKFNDVLISSYNISGAAGGDIPTESISFVYGKIEVVYRPQDSKTGKLGSPITFSWDLKKNDKSVMSMDSTAPIPEPSTWAMLVAGLLFVVYFGRNRVRPRATAA
jgi:type VI secretion system secreted protein Hcp